MLSSKKIEIEFVASTKVIEATKKTGFSMEGKINGEDCG